MSGWCSGAACITEVVQADRKNHLTCEAAELDKQEKCGQTVVSSIQRVASYFGGIQARLTRHAGVCLLGTIQHTIQQIAYKWCCNDGGSQNVDAK